MKSPRVVSIALAAVFACAGSGCRTAGLSDLTRRDLPRPISRLTAAEHLADHNANARKVQSLEASPSISANGKIGVGLSGKLALERPRNFNLTLTSTMAGEEANIGSNDDEFWFWIKRSEPKAVYYARYGDSGSSPLASTLQPDWIIESLGLQEISEEDIARTRVGPGTAPDTVVLTQPPGEGPDKQFLKETVVRESTGRIIEQRIFSPDRKNLLAKSTVYDHVSVELPAPEGSSPTMVFLPRRMRLEWAQENLVLDVNLNKAKVNPVFPEARREALFAKPAHEGYAQVNLAENAGLASFEAEAGGAGPTTRSSLPVPPPRVRLDEPKPLGRLDPKADVDRSQIALSRSELAREPVEAVVGPMVPTVSEPSNTYVRQNSGWKRGMSGYLER